MSQPKRRRPRPLYERENIRRLKQSMPHGFDSGVIWEADAGTSGSEADNGPAPNRHATVNDYPSVPPLPPGVELTRPEEWPAYMSWPIMRDIRVLHEQKATPEQYSAYLESCRAKAAAIPARARQVDRWIRKEGVRLKQGDAVRVPSDPYYGVLFAALLDPEGPGEGLMNAVALWGHSEMRTRDGGILRATPDELRVATATQQSVEALVAEAAARGWASIKAEGTPEFCQFLTEAVKAAGLPAEITEKRAPFGLSRKTYRVMPSPPAFDHQEAQQDAEALENAKKQKWQPPAGQLEPPRRQLPPPGPPPLESRDDPGTPIG